MSEIKITPRILQDIRGDMRAQYESLLRATETLQREMLGRIDMLQREMLERLGAIERRLTSIEGVLLSHESTLEELVGDKLKE